MSLLLECTSRIELSGPIADRAGRAGRSRKTGAKRKPAAGRAGRAGRRGNGWKRQRAGGATRALKPADSSARRGGKSPHRQEGCALALIVSPKKLTSPRLFVIVRRFRKNASVRVS